ncbi:unnamed protein product, partial [Rotaria sp. Silwood1]
DTPPPMLPYPHHFVTPDNIDIDLRLHNHDLQAKIKSIVSSLISKSTPKNCIQNASLILILYEQVELGLSKEEIAKRVQNQ